MKTTRLFRNIWRANAVIIFGAGGLALAVGVIGVFSLLKEVTRERAFDAVVNTDGGRNIGQSIALGSPVQIAGHPWMLVPLESEQHYDHVYLSKEVSAARNYAFVSRTAETRWLYPHSRFLIVDYTQLPAGTQLPPEEHGGPSTALISFEVVQQDTNGDQRLTPEDASNLVFTRPDGTGATSVLENVSDILSQDLMGEDILVIYQDPEGYAAATFSLADFSLVKRERLTLPPADS